MNTTSSANTSSAHNLSSKDSQNKHRNEEVLNSLRNSLLNEYKEKSENNSSNSNVTRKWAELREMWLKEKENHSQNSFINISVQPTGICLLILRCHGNFIPLIRSTPQKKRSLTATCSKTNSVCFVSMNFVMLLVMKDPFNLVINPLNYLRKPLQFLDTSKLKTNRINLQKLWLVYSNETKIGHIQQTHLLNRKQKSLNSRACKRQNR